MATSSADRGPASRRRVDLEVPADLTDEIAEDSQAEMRAVRPLLGIEAAAVVGHAERRTPVPSLDSDLDTVLRPSA